jgi:hypothetical protein
MKYPIAILIAALLIGAMFVFNSAMLAQMEIWEAARSDLMQFQVFCVKAAIAMDQYWYVFASLILVACLGGAAMTPATRSSQ